MWVNSSKVVDAVKDFYSFSFKNKSVQEALIKTTGVDDFVTTAVKVARQNGFVFSEQEMRASLDGYGERNTYDNIDFGNPWINKIKSVGWSPLGYVRN